jgi:hypothetical protein
MPAAFMNYDANSKTATQPPQNFLSDKNGFVTADQAYVASLVGFGGIPIAPSDAGDISHYYLAEHGGRHN